MIRRPFASRQGLASGSFALECRDPAFRLAREIAHFGHFANSTE
jgi:hypothetical protein